MSRFGFQTIVQYCMVSVVFFACSNSEETALDTDSSTLGGDVGIDGTDSRHTDGDTDADTDSDADGDTDNDTDVDTDADTNSDTDMDSDSDTDADTDTDSDADTNGSTDQQMDTDPDTATQSDDTTDSATVTDSRGDASDTGDDPEKENGALTGVVMSPSGDLPIPGALVYLTQIDPPPIPEHAFDYKCDNMTGKKYTFSGSDGTWLLENVPEGAWKLVTRKGHFRRVRDIVVTGGETLSVPVEVTTLPGRASEDGSDSIPRYAVLLADPDKVFNLLAKFGMGETDSLGNLQFGTESFIAYSDRISQAGYPDSSTLFADIDTLMQYHMIFLPCAARNVGPTFALEHVELLREYVSRGGKIYNSCCVSLWTEAAFPDYVDFYNESLNSEFDVGRISQTAYATSGRILDSDMAAWLNVVTEEDVNSFPFINGYVKIDGLNEVDDGHGLEADEGVVKPYAWVEDVQAYAGSPLMVTYDFDAGKVFYSVYETSLENPTDASLTPQEYVLLYVILEVGVCNDVIVV